MASEIDCLQESVEAIRATGDAELAGRAWHALSTVLVSYARIEKGVSRFPIQRRVTLQDVEWFLRDLG